MVESLLKEREKEKTRKTRKNKSKNNNEVQNDELWNNSYSQAWLKWQIRCRWLIIEWKNTEKLRSCDCDMQRSFRYLEFNIIASLFGVIEFRSYSKTLTFASWSILNYAVAFIFNDGRHVKLDRKCLSVCVFMFCIGLFLYVLCLCQLYSLNNNE